MWSSLPPIKIASEASAKPLIMVMASQDSASFFRDKSVGAEFPLSVIMLGLLASPNYPFSAHFFLVYCHDI